MRVRTSLFLLAAATGVSASAASAAVFNSGNLVVSFVNGHQNSAGNPRLDDFGATVSLREYNLGGILGNSVTFNDAGLSPTPLSHHEVLEAVAASAERLGRLLEGSMMRF